MAQQVDDDISPEALEAELELLSKKMDRLRLLYEQYFLGIEKLPPLTVQKDVVLVIHRLGQYRIRKASLKFRYQSLIQRFSAYKSYWARTQREIEEGTYRRHQMRVKRRERSRAEHGELTAQDIASIQVIRDTLGEAAAHEAEAKRRSELLAEAGGDIEIEVDDAPLRMNSQERARARYRAMTETEATVADEGDAAEEFIRQTFSDAAPAAPRPAAPAEPPRAEPSQPAASASEIRGATQDDLARRAEALRAFRARLAGVAPPAAPAAAPQAAAPSAASPAPRPSPPPAAAVPGPRPATPFPTGFGSPQAPPRPTPSPAAIQQAEEERRARRVFDQLVATKRQLQEPVDKLSFDAVRQSMAKQAAALREKHQCRDVDFDVVVKEGKAYLKPVPK
jgi:hypothetical protein